MQRKISGGKERSVGGVASMTPLLGGGGSVGGTDVRVEKSPVVRPGVYGRAGWRSSRRRCAAVAVNACYVVGLPARIGNAVLKYTHTKRSCAHTRTSLPLLSTESTAAASSGQEQIFVQWVACYVTCFWREGE